MNIRTAFSESLTEPQASVPWDQASPAPSPSRRSWSDTTRRARPVGSLLVALFLQFAPLIRTIEPAVVGVLQPVFLLLRWATAAAAVAGGAHALSGATGLTTPSTARGTNGVSMSYRAGITSDAHGAGKSYSATGLPPGLTVTSRSGGIISGTPNTAGTFSSRITGWENNPPGGNSYTATVTFTIVDVAPGISVQPQPRTVTEGGSVTFTVTGTGTGLTYRWLRDDLELANATASSLTINPVKLSDAGNYQVRILNSGGSILSAKALLTVNPGAVPPISTALSLNQMVHEGETVRLTATATAGSTTPTLIWTQDGTPVPGANASPFVLSTITPAKAGTYRAVASANGLSTTSGPVVVNVVPPLRILSVLPAPTKVEVNSGSILGRRYVLESTSLGTPTVWQPLTNAIADGTSIRLTDPLPDPNARIYRVRVEAF